MNSLAKNVGSNDQNCPQNALFYGAKTIIIKSV